MAIFLLLVNAARHHAPAVCPGRRAVPHRWERRGFRRCSAEGLCIALAYHRTQARVLGPVLSATLDAESTTRLQAAVAAYDREVGHLWEGHALAA